MNHTLNETNHLTISWVTNGFLCNNNTIVDINLLNENCYEKCEATNSASYCNQNCSWAKKSNRSPYTFDSSLQPCNNYTYSFAISGLNSNQSASVEAKYKFSNVENLKAEDIIVSNIDNSSMMNISVTWSYEYTECDQEFEVEITNEKRSFFTKLYNFTIGNVTACSEYEIKVYPRIDDNDKELFGQNVTLTTKRVDPSPIRDFNVSFPSPGNAIEVRWTPPIYGEKCIDFYEISVESEFESIIWPPVDCCKEFITVNYSCVNYNVTLKTLSNDPDETTTLASSTTSELVTISNENSKAEQEEILHIRTEARLLTTSEISPTQSSGQTDTEIYLTVEVNTTRNKCEISKYAFQCNNSINGNGSYEESLMPNVTMRNLLPDTDYNCSAKVLNEAGWSDDGFSTPFKTKEGSEQKN
jgi:hypothetical protein